MADLTPKLFKRCAVMLIYQLEREKCLNPNKRVMLEPKNILLFNAF